MTCNSRLNNNNLVTLDDSFFQGLPILSIVDLSFNKINYISGDVFELSQVTLTSVNISNNAIAALPERVFRQFYEEPGKEMYV